MVEKEHKAVRNAQLGTSPLWSKLSKQGIYRRHENAHT